MLVFCFQHKIPDICNVKDEKLFYLITSEDSVHVGWLSEDTVEWWMARPSDTRSKMKGGAIEDGDEDQI